VAPHSAAIELNTPTPVGTAIDIVAHEVLENADIRLSQYMRQGCDDLHSGNSVFAGTALSVNASAPTIASWQAD